MLRRSSLLAVVIASACASTASAQHANFVLFGQATEGVKDIDPSNRFVHPITAPYFAEDSFVTSDIRAWAIYHSFDGGVAGIDNAKVYAVQARLALTNQVQLVAYKDGYTDYSAGIEDGYNDVALGLKWNFLQDWGNNLHAAVGVGYELPWGDQGLDNNDEFRAWISVNKGIGAWHLGGTLNYRHADNNGEGKSINLNLHGDYYVNKYFSPVVELNYYQPVSGDEAVALSPADVASWGTNEEGLTIGVGAEFRPIENLGVRAAYEFPALFEDQLFGYRITLSAVYSF